MKDILIFVARIHGLWWTRNHNVIDWRNNTYLKRGKSTDSAILNPEKNNYGFEGSPKKTPEFDLGNGGPGTTSLRVGPTKETTDYLLDLGILVSRGSKDKSFTGLIIPKESLELALKKDPSLIHATAIPSEINDLKTIFTIPDFFTDNIPFQVIISENQDLDKVTMFLQEHIN